MQKLLLFLLSSTTTVCHGFQLQLAPSPVPRSRGGGRFSNGAFVVLGAPSSSSSLLTSSSSPRRRRVPIAQTKDARRRASGSSRPYGASPRYTTSVSDDYEYAIENVEKKKKTKMAAEQPRLRAAASSAVASFFLSVSLFLLLLLSSTVFHPDAAWAVQSGGRMGGSFGSGGSSRSRSSGSISSRQYSGSSSYGRGYSGGGGYYSSRPNIIVSPGISPFYNPFYSPFYSPFYAPRPSSGVVVVDSGPSLGGIVFFAGFFFLIAAVLSNMSNSVRDTFGDNKFGSRTKLGSDSSILGPGISVVEMSVALQVPNRDSPSSILSALHRLSNTARTDSRVGLQNLTSQVALELLRRKSSIVAASTRGRHFTDRDDSGGGRAQRAYNDISIRERAKFQRETVSKYGGVDYGSSDNKTTRDYSADATIAVITIIMLIDGDSTSKALGSNVNSLRDVEEALSRIASDAKADACLRSAEILWTPEERGETLTMKEVLADYSNLRSV